MQLQQQQKHQCIIHVLRSPKKPDISLNCQSRGFILKKCEQADSPYKKGGGREAVG